MNIFKFYAIKNDKDEFYIGHNGQFNKDISKARLFKSEKTAIRHLLVDDYNNLRVLEVKMSFDNNAVLITDEAYIAYNNLNYELWKRKSISKSN